MYKFDGVNAKPKRKQSLDAPRQRSEVHGADDRTYPRAYSDIELNKTERHLEAEIRRESCVPSRDKKVARLRLRGARMLHSKFVLLTVVVLNLIDCALVLGELILDIHFIREFRTNSDVTSQLFIDTMQARYPEHLYDNDIDNMQLLYAQLYLAECKWIEKHELEDVTTFSLNYTRRNEQETMIVSSTKDYGTNRGPAYERRELMSSNGIGNQNNLARNHNVHLADLTGLNKNHTEQTRNSNEQPHKSHHGKHSVWEHIAHGLHKASIAILGILFVENLTKLICMGKAFLTNKLEVFDALVVIISFVVDLVLLRGLMEYRVQDAVFILTFLLPWRVIRVVNSLIVAVLDHEHFRLKMLYQEKKAVTAELKMLKTQEKGWDFHLKKIEHFCESEGIPKWKIRQHTAMGRKQSTITTMASLALNGFLKGMVFSPADRNFLDKTLSQRDKDNANLGIITETDDNLADVSQALGPNTEYLCTMSAVTDGRDDIEHAGIESAHIINHQLNVEEEPGYMNQEQGVMKAASKATAKAVTFLSSENETFISRHDSLDSNEDLSFADDDSSFIGWK